MNWRLLLLLGVASVVTAGENLRLACQPLTFEVVPGEPIRVEFTVESDSAAPVRLHLPENPLLKLRAVEKYPVHRTAAGAIVHRKAVIWQALEPGTVKLDAVSMECRGRKLVFPEIAITVRDPGP